VCLGDVRAPDDPAHEDPELIWEPIVD
jgi:hypothetical protein